MSGFHPPVEEYLETILELEESGIPPMRARIVERLGVSAPAVSETVGRLAREGYVTLDDSRVIRLTTEGRVYATSVMRRHRLAERLLTDVMGMPWSQVHEEACRLEHAISPLLEEHLVRLLGDPGSCPHGNPIPGSANVLVHGPLDILSTTADGGSVTVRRLDEELEAWTEAMVELESQGVSPGTPLTKTGLTADGMTFDLAGRSVTIPEKVAARIWVDAA